MTAPPLKGNAAVCARKRRFADEFVARVTAQDECERDDLERLAVYQCPACRGWHLTSNGRAPNSRSVTATQLVHRPDGWPDLEFLRAMLRHACDAAGVSQRKERG